ncbi:Bardet-Biedl syndrome 1 protein [Hyalella azteca]|uniref:Bardet-Biedl syndrome 1 protein n=1 Tax=Hyalella azteca TaxID=294128 RepID=A0A8B7P8T7_HYAAZ|nr:Bardet-Biedl syndrome 1 protein [Hyalella azteca]
MSPSLRSPCPSCPSFPPALLPSFHTAPPSLLPSFPPASSVLLLSCPSFPSALLFLLPLLPSFPPALLPSVLPAPPALPALLPSCLTAPPPLLPSWTSFPPALLLGLVLIFKDKYVVDTIHMEAPVSAMLFGRFGREDNTFILVMKGGGLHIKILRRKARFAADDSSGLGPAAATRLNVPKKTKLFVDQTMRERENSIQMHRVFQHDLYKLRLNTARQYVRALETSSNPVSITQTEPLKLSAQVLGLGPTFKIKVELQNTSASSPSLGLMVVFHADHHVYNVQNSVIQVPMLVPGVAHVVETLVNNVSELGVADTVKVLVVKENSTRPVLTALISMPVADTVS